VAEDEIARALAEVTPDVEERTARELAEGRARSLAGLPAGTATRRLAGFLARKGYGPGLAEKVAREALAARAADEQVGDAQAGERLPFS
jgi:regulatory protein